MTGTDVSGEPEEDVSGPLARLGARLNPRARLKPLKS